MIQNAIHRITGDSFGSDESCKINNFWQSRLRREYHIEGYDEAIEGIRKFGSFDDVDYAFWV